LHSEADIDALVAALSDVWRRLTLQRRAIKLVLCACPGIGLRSGFKAYISPLSLKIKIESMH